VNQKTLDALVRAWRTFYVNIGVDAAALIGLGLTDLLKTADISSEVFWIAFGGLLAKSVLTSLAAFLLRLKVTPSNIDKSTQLQPVVTVAGLDRVDGPDHRA
jgi:hypothetical protein